MQTSFAKEACPSGEHWVESHFRRSYVKYDGTHVSASQVSGHCRKNPRGYDRWHQRLSNTRPKIWGYSGEKTKRWTIEEVEMAYEALSILPDQLLNQADIKLHRMDKSQHVNNPATANFNDIALYNLSFESKDSLAQILAHELSHIFFQNFSEQDKTEFRAAAGWIRDERTPGAFVVLKDKKFIQNDSKISIDEDFALSLIHI